MTLNAREEKQMPEVQPTEQTTEEIQQQNESQESLQNNVLDKIKSGNVFKSLAEDLPIEQEAEPRGNAKPVEEEQAQEENVQEESQEDDEEVIPKSKVQARFDQMTAKIKSMEQRLSEKEAAASVPADDIQRQLDAMSEDALEDTLIQTRIAKERARDNPENLAELVRLERRIEKQIVTAPQKFVQNQVSEANKTINRLASEGEINEANFGEVQKIAKAIYDKYPKMQKTIDGQSMAFELAVDHYKNLGKANSVSATTQNLKGQINNLKKKTALDTKNVKGGGEKVNLDRLRNNAMNGSMKDKERFAANDNRFKIDAMIPDFLKG